jgi:hypothetical protein
MGRYVRMGLTVGALALGLAVAGCENFDPTDIFDSEIFSSKKKLPGERRPVFPEGTPGVPQGVPPDLVKGHQPAAEPPPKEATVEPVEAKPKPKPKPKPNVVAKPAEPPASTTGTVRAAQPGAQGPQSPDPTQSQSPPAASAWPSSPQRSGGSVWPDPPAPR